MSPSRSKSTKNAKAQAGKTVVLSALLIVLVVMVVRHLAGGDGPPATASAQPGKVTSASTDQRAARADSEVARLTKTTDLARDLFVFDGQAYERLDDGEQVAVESGPSVSSQTQALVAEARRALNVQATAGGEAPRALINGQWHNVGDKIAGFTLVEVEARSVVVLRGGIRVRLSM